MSASKASRINLNLPVHSKGYLTHFIAKLNKWRFRMASYSPVTIFIAEHLTEAAIIVSFSGQPNYPLSLIFYIQSPIYI